MGRRPADGRNSKTGTSRQGLRGACCPSCPRRERPRPARPISPLRRLLLPRDLGFIHPRDSPSPGANASDARSRAGKAVGRLSWAGLPNRQSPFKSLSSGPGLPTAGTPREPFPTRDGGCSGCAASTATVSSSTPCTARRRRSRRARTLQPPQVLPQRGVGAASTLDRNQRQDDRL